MRMEARCFGRSDIVGNDQSVWMEVTYETTEEEPEPDPEPIDEEHAIEITAYYAALTGEYPVDILPVPTCRETMMLRKLLDPEYELPFVYPQSRVEHYLFDLIDGVQTMIDNIPKSDKEKYLHVAIGGTVEKMPNPDACELNYFMDRWVKSLNQ